MKNHYLLKYIFINILMVLLFYGCVYSVHPLFTEDDLIVLDELFGKWREDGNTTWEFTQGDGNYYKVIYIDKADTTYLEAGLGELGDKYYLDFTLGSNEKFNDMELFHMFPTHNFFRISFGEAELTIQPFATEWLENLIEDKRIRIQHEQIEDQVLLTASTNELQKFIQKYSNEPKAFGDKVKLTAE